MSVLTHVDVDGSITRRGHLVGSFISNSQGVIRRQGLDSTSLLERLDQMTAIMRSQQEALSQFARENEAMKVSMDEMKEEVVCLRKEVAEMKACDVEVTASIKAPGNLADSRLDTNLTVS